MTDTPTHYGRAKITTIRRDWNKLRELIRAEGSPAIQEQWDRCERWLEALPLPRKDET